MPKHKFYIKFPYYGNVSFKIRKKLKKLINQYYPQLKPIIIFTNNFKIKNFFPYKDRVEVKARSSLIYKYSCSCNATYLGATVRHLNTRISEHLGISHRTGMKITKPSYSSIREHCESNNCIIDANNFEIVTSANPEDIYIAESILIKQQKPNLNSGTSLELYTM